MVSKPDNVVKTSDVDYSKVSEYLNSFSQSKTSLQSFVSTNSKNSTSAPTLSDKEFETVKQKQNELLNFFKEKKYSSKQINDYLFKNYPQYKDEYNKSYNQINSSNSTQMQSSLIFQKIYLHSSTQDVNESSLNKTVENLKIAKTTLIALSAAASIAAAGFFLAAFLSFGATTAWGAGCSAAAAILGAASAGCDIALTKYDEERSKIKNAVLTAIDIFKLGNVMYSVAYAALVSVSSASTAFSCFFPALLGILGLVSTVLGLLDLFKSW